MGAATLPAEQEQDGAPVEGGAEATRTAANLFQYSQYVHAGAGAEECEHAEDGECQDGGHFHAWVCLPNKLQHRDIQEKARAAKARRKRAMRDAGGDGRPASDAYEMLESELDDLMAGDRERLLTEVAERKGRENFGEYVTEVRENDERFEDYLQQVEEYRRLAALEEDQRDPEEWKVLDELMTDFGKAIQDKLEDEKQREIEALRGLSEDQIRDIVRQSRIDGEATDTSINTYYVWMAFVCTRVPPANTSLGRRRFATLEELRGAPPEAVEAIEDAIRDLESRLVRGDALGN